MRQERPRPDRSPSRARPLARAGLHGPLLWCLLLALWAVPWLGQLHQIAHGLPSARALVAVVQRLDAVAPAAHPGHQEIAPADAAHGRLQAGLHSDNTPCGLFDGLALGMALLGAPQPAPTPLPPTPTARWTPPAPWLAVALRLFDSRAPPGQA